MKPTIASLILLSAFSFTTATADNVRVGDTAFATHYETPDGRIEAKGWGVLRYAYVMKVYAAVLYGPKDTAARDLLYADAPKRLEIAYLVSIDGPDFAKGANAMLRKQLSAEKLRSLEARLALLHKAYQDVTAGDRYALTYSPEAGTVLELNGKPLVQIEGLDFAQAYFGIWLAEPPLSAKLKQALTNEDT
jgi:hypothetical protein